MDRIKTLGFALSTVVASLIIVLIPDSYLDEAAPGIPLPATPQFAAQSPPVDPQRPSLMPSPITASIQIPTREPVEYIASAEVRPTAPALDWLLVMYPQLVRIVELENLLPDEALGELSPMLSDDDPVIRLAALEALTDLTHPALLSTLSAVLDDTNPQVRVLALQALGSRGDSLAVNSIESYLFDPEQEVRLAAIQALSNHENEAAVQALAGVIFDPETEIRHHAVNALGEIGGETAILYLLQARTDPDADIRANASAILDELGEVAEY